ncbi:group II intron reverse transcriptase/maturase [Solwaraspora sp. WMMB335]|uniref:group II intron reverse transcriptase/maturase n=1 Tax=Solwaraspora sp. WMMB335 TaxID=3404118 RepID=UPI003BA27032
MLSNIYLHRLDEFVETVLIPEYTRGRIRKQDTAYARVRAARDRAHRRGDRATARKLRQQLRGMPSGDPRDPGFRRLHCARYADDTLLGFAGPKAEAEQIKARLAAFLRDDLKLELSQEKTLITHARTQAARFLGYEITVHHNDRKVTRGRRSANGVVGLRVPPAVIKAKSAPYLARGKPERRARLINDDDHTIVNTYAAEYRGIVQYYLLAGNVARLYRLHWVMETSLLKTLANKHRSSVSKMARKYKTTIDSGGSGTRSSATVSRSRASAATRSWSPGCWRTDVRSAATPTASRCTTSAAWRTCTGRDSHNPRGLSRWHDGGARPSWSAPHATMRSTRGNRPRNSRSSHRRATCGESRMRRSDWGPPEKDPQPLRAPRQRPTSALLHNLSDAVRRAVGHHRRCLMPSTEQRPAAEPTPVSRPMDAAIPEVIRLPQGLRVQRTRTRHADVHALRDQGVGAYTIARRLGLDPKTVRRYADAATPEDLLGPNGTVRDNILDTFKPYLRQRITEGVTGTNQLLTEIRGRGNQRRSGRSAVG